MRSPGKTGPPRTEQTLGYCLAPRLNAAGRLYHAREAIVLLTATAREEALPLAERLEAYNRERRPIRDADVGRGGATGVGE
ncbi:MAG: hypothetical protein MPW15_18740 [Candidatus Manganitrophus sp.]|nr:hypothetical protein [Candidatus Manganitrophus sp.]